MHLGYPVGQLSDGSGSRSFSRRIYDAYLDQATFYGEIVPQTFFARFANWNKAMLLNISKSALSAFTSTSP